MPLHIDVKINEDLIERIHIARLSKNGMQPDSTNTYGVIRSAEETQHTAEWPFKIKVFPNPDFFDWDEPDARFEHRYGDSSIVCLSKALQALESLAALDHDSINNHAVER